MSDENTGKHQYYKQEDDHKDFLNHDYRNPWCEGEDNAIMLPSSGRKGLCTKFTKRPIEQDDYGLQSTY